MEADDKRGVLTGDEARDALEDFFTTWLEDWWRVAHGELIMKSLPLIPCGGIPDPSESFYSSSPDRPFIPLGGCGMTVEMMKRGANPFCLYWGLQTIFDEWEKARDELEKLFWPQSKSPKVGRTYTRTGKGAEIPPGKPGPKPRKRRKKKRPNAGRPPKYKTDAARSAARKRQLARSNAKRKKKRAREKKARDFVKKTQKAAQKIAEDLGGELMKRALKR